MNINDKKCSVCGADIQAGQYFCKNCGTVLDLSVLKSEMSPLAPPLKTSRPAHFVPGEKESMSESDVHEGKPVSAPSSRIKKLLPIVIVAAVLVIVLPGRIGGGNSGTEFPAGVAMPSYDYSSAETSNDDEEQETDDKEKNSQGDGKSNADAGSSVSAPMPTTEENRMPVGNIGNTPVFTKIYASSTRAAMSGNTYEPTLAVDGDWSTAWCEGSAGAGDGEWIELKSDEPQQVTGIRILNGYFKSKNLYDINNTIAKALVKIDAGEYEWDLTHSFNGFQEFTFPSPVDTYSVRIVIAVSTPYGDGLDTLVSEIEVF